MLYSPDILSIPDFDTLNQAILKHESYVQKLKSRRNALIPVARLLPEILCRIFDLTVDELERSGRIPFNLIAFTHVCQYWRNVAISCSTLWTDIAMGCIPWFDEMLKRSMMSSLTIRACLLVSPAEEGCPLLRNLQVALTHIPRINELSIYGFSGGIGVQHLITDLPASAPMLELLAISMRGILYQVAGLDWNRCKLAPNALSHVPRLRSLHLCRCDIESWESPMFHRLIDLSLADILDECRPSTAQLLAILQRLPGLQRLALQTCLPTDGGYVSTLSAGEGSIHFSQLEGLILSGKLVELEPLLRRLTISPASTIKVKSNDPGVTGVLLKLLQKLRRSAETVSPLLVRTLKISECMVPRPFPLLNVTLRTYTSAVTPNSNWALEYKPDLQLTQAWTGILPTEADGSTFLTEICNHLPAKDLTCLHISFSQSVDPQSVASTLGALPCLESILVSGKFVSHLIRSLTMTSDSVSLAFPCLRHLSLCDVVFTSDVENGVIRFDVLRDCLMERYELGFEIEGLSVYRGSRVSSRDIALLREIVVDVYWDDTDIPMTGRTVVHHDELWD